VSEQRESRRLRILEALQGRASDGYPESTHLCSVAAEITGLSGAGIMVMSDDYPIGSICSSDAVSRSLEDLQYELGVGPCVDAYSTGSPVLEPDLATAHRRWPAFGGHAVAAGARAMFGFPMSVGSVRIGALNLYRDRTGDLDDEQHADALVMADVAAEAVLLLQSDARSGDLAAGLDGSELHLVVHQAAGMVSVQLGLPIAEALVRLRAWAFASDLPLRDVAQDVVERRLRFDGPDGGLR
jgi:GAF domain